MASHTQIAVFEADGSEDVEVWAPVREDLGPYDVSSRGRVRNRKTGKILKLNTNLEKKHPTVGLRRKTMYVHHLVLEAFVGPRPPGLICRHLDDNPLNNVPGNLAWGTHRENCMDYVRMGRAKKKRSPPLTNADVELIEELRDDGFFQHEIAKYVGISRKTVSGVLCKRWDREKRRHGSEQ